MKARIKGTNIIVECIDTGILINENKGVECRHSNGAIEVIPGDCLIEIENNFDWQSFRAEAALRIFCAKISKGVLAWTDVDIDGAIETTDKFIAKLKEKEIKP